MASTTESVSRRTVCVTGMHRSGTSLAARVVGLLGVSLGDPEGLLEPGDDNTAGYWEHAALKEFDEGLLAELGGSWDAPPVLDAGWESASGLEPARARARGIYESAFPADGDAIVGWKDPRASLLLPFWETVIDVGATIVVVRDPREVAESLAVRNAMDTPQASLLWLRYVLAAARDAPDHLLLTYGSFFDEPDRVAERVADHLGLEPPSDELLREIRDSVDPDLRHHDEAVHGPGGDPFIEMANAVWNEGSPDPGVLDPRLSDAIATGWVRSPMDGAQLSDARSSWVLQSDTLARRSEQLERTQELLAQVREKRVADKAAWQAERDAWNDYYNSRVQRNIRRVVRRLGPLKRFAPGVER